MPTTNQKPTTPPPADHLSFAVRAGELAIEAIRDGNLTAATIFWTEALTQVRLARALPR